MISDKNLTELKGIGPRRAELLGRLGLYCVDDLLRFAPRKYRDYSKTTLIMQAEDGADVVIKLNILDSPKIAHIRRGMSVVSVRGSDESGIITLSWFNQPYRMDSVFAGQIIYVSGVVTRKNGVRMTSPSVSRALPGIVPVYPLTKGIKSSIITNAVKDALSYCGEIQESLPKQIIDKYALCSLDFALRTLHAPQDVQSLEKARYRLLFEDLMMLSLMLSMHRKQSVKKNGRSFKTEGLLDKFLELLPYAPTNAQHRVLCDIENDMSTSTPMNRLVQGDVGSGKTILAFFAMYVAMENGFQSALMAPTEILAEQHRQNARAFFGEKTVLLTGSMKKKERDAIHARMAAGEPLCVIGTHALLFDESEDFCPALVIADEQHRFGVGQRAKISEKGEKQHGISPDVLIMSATPIPRTLSLIIYGDLDVSVLDELPPGRKAVRTRIVPDEKRLDMYRFIEKQVREGKQAYVVCPLVEESEMLENVKSAQELFKELSAFMNVRLALLHGKLSSQKKDEITRSFRDGEIDVLVATTVIEVGVDVRRATVMAIENADRFGLAQLHQLRGRVGRGDMESYCFLLCGTDSANARERLLTLVSTSDGFEIAQKDLAMRGPGEFLGKKQHGDTDFSDILGTTDTTLLTCAKEAADMLANGIVDETDSRVVFCEVERRLRDKTKEIALN